MVASVASVLSARTPRNKSVKEASEMAERIVFFSSWLETAREEEGQRRRKMLVKEGRGKEMSQLRRLYAKHDRGGCVEPLMPNGSGSPP
jgi:hypothetical protein